MTTPTTAVAAPADAGAAPAVHEPRGSRRMGIMYTVAGLAVLCEAAGAAYWYLIRPWHTHDEQTVGIDPQSRVRRRSVGTSGPPPTRRSTTEGAPGATTGRGIQTSGPGRWPPGG